MMNEDTVTIIGRFIKSEFLKKTLILNISLTINGHPIEWNYMDAISIASNWNNHQSDFYPEFTHSIFEPFSCSCGIAACAGVYDGIYIKHRKHSVEWRASAADGYSFLPKSFFSFSRKQYEKEHQGFLFWLGMQDDHDNELRVDISDHGGKLLSISDFLAWIKD
jgi:hypothetical protein